MSSFNNFFSIYEPTEPPPIVSSDYQNILDQFYYPTNSSTEDTLEDTPEERKLKWITTTYFSNVPKNPSTKSTKSNIESFKSKEEYVQTISPYIYQALQDNGLDADLWTPIVVAQTAVESGWGNEFSRRNHNYGGIKGKGSGKVSTKEYNPETGEYYTIQDEFKKYDSIEDFADDFVKRLKNRFNAFSDSPTEYVQNIKDRGYFTAPLSDYQNLIDSTLQEVNKYLS